MPSKGFQFNMLNPAQKEAVKQIHGPVLILAGAGTATGSSFSSRGGMGVVVLRHAERQSRIERPASTRIVISSSGRHPSVRRAP